MKRRLIVLSVIAASALAFNISTTGVRASAQDRGPGHSVVAEDKGPTVIVH